MKTFLFLCFTLLLGLLTVVYGTYAVQTLWAWFLVPGGVAVPETRTLYGIALILSVVRCGRAMTPQEYNEEADDTLGRALASAFAGLVAITFVLAFGWILK